MDCIVCLFCVAFKFSVCFRFFWFGFDFVILLVFRMSVLAKFLQQNKSFSNGLLSNQSDLLQQCKKGQWPQVLWIGCSDSRCSESNLLQSNLGDIFVHVR